MCDYPTPPAWDARSWCSRADSHRSGREFVPGPKVEEILGRSREEVLGHVVSEFIHRDTVAQTVPMWMSLIGEGKGATRSSRRCFVHPDGTEVWVERARFSSR
jgi:PAS domain S-box-containing protein